MADMMWPDPTLHNARVYNQSLHGGWEGESRKGSRCIRARIRIEIGRGLGSGCVVMKRLSHPQVRGVGSERGLAWCRLLQDVSPAAQSGVVHRHHRVVFVGKLRSLPVPGVGGYGQSGRLLLNHLTLLSHRRQGLVIGTLDAVGREEVGGLGRVRVVWVGSGEGVLVVERVRSV